MKRTVLFKLLAFVMVLGGTVVSAQAQYVAPKTTVGFNVGTQGVGIEGKRNVVGRLDLRLGADIIPINNLRSTQYLGNNQTTIDLQPRFSNVHLLADWRPFKFNESNPLSGNFKLTAGAAYFIKSEGTADIALAGSFYYGDIEIPRDEVGTVTAQAKWGHFAPYGGIGLDNIPLFNSFFVGFDIGTYYLSSPSASIVGTNFLKDNDTNQPQLQRNLRTYRFLPVFQVNFNFMIK